MGITVVNFNVLCMKVNSRFLALALQFLVIPNKSLLFSEYNNVWKHFINIWPALKFQNEPFRWGDLS
jgi:hypothetical protein